MRGLVFRNKYRSRLEIVADILNIVRKGSKKTHIMFQANLSYRLLCRYLDEVLEAGLIRVDDSLSNYYFLTEKGELFLARFHEYIERKRKVEKELRSITEEKLALERMLEGVDED